MIHESIAMEHLELAPELDCARAETEEISVELEMIPPEPIQFVVLRSSFSIKTTRQRSKDATWHQVLLFPSLVCPYSSPMQSIGTPEEEGKPFSISVSCIAPDTNLWTP